MDKRNGSPSSLREFRFPTNCADYNRLYDLLQAEDGDKYFANLTLLAKGQGRLWITNFRITPSQTKPTPNNGVVQWIKFSVEIKLPKP